MMFLTVMFSISVSFFSFSAELFLLLIVFLNGDQMLQKIDVPVNIISVEYLTYQYIWMLVLYEYISMPPPMNLFQRFVRKRGSVLDPSVMNKVLLIELSVMKHLLEIVAFA